MRSSTRFITAILTLMLMVAGTTGCAGTAAPSKLPANPLATLAPQHPKLVLTDQRLAELKTMMATDPVLARYAQDVIAKADELLTAKPLEHVLIGPRLLRISQETVRRVYTLGLAWRLTGQEKYANALRENLLTVCRFADWNPGHFLDVAEMSHAVGVGYDWLYGQLDEPTRKEIRQALITHGLEEGIGFYETKERRNKWWVTDPYNWNIICNGGLIIGSLAIADTDPQYAKKILPVAVASIPIALASYDPDGAWGEGPGYWGYGSSYMAYEMAALNSALGTDFGMSDRKGLSNAGDFPIYMAGPTGRFVSFADVGENASARPQSTLYWLAGRYGKPQLAAAQAKMLEKGKAGPLDFIWYVPAGKVDVAKRDLDKLFHGPVEVAVFRSAWDDNQALFLSVKAGYNAVNHGHLDLGTFELDALGQRWASDLGADDYNLPGYWLNQEGGQRWRYYRLGSFSHNVVLVDNKQQRVAGKTTFSLFQPGDAPRAVLDLSSAYDPAAVSSIRRGVMVVASRKAALVQDELNLVGKHDVAWGMTTYAKITPKGQTAELELDGKKLLAQIVSPPGAQFTVESAEQKPPQKPNEGVSRLMIRLPGQSGSLRFVVAFSPAWTDGQTPKIPAVVPLDQWGK